jgi:SAM-dependent methyltransferase
MTLTQNLRNKVRGFLKSYGAHKVKKQMWDAEYSQGEWNYLNSTLNDCVYPFIAKSAHGGSILDLGCGSGNTANEMDPNTYRRYTGVDISSVATDKARQRTEENARGHKSLFFASDITCYVPTEQFDLILFRESIHYIPRPKIKATLDRYAQYLRKDGSFIVRLWNRDGKFKDIIAIIEDNFDVVEKYLPEHVSSIVIVFRPRAAS